MLALIDIDGKCQIGLMLPFRVVIRSIIKTLFKYSNQVRQLWSHAKLRISRQPSSFKLDQTGQCADQASKPMVMINGNHHPFMNTSKRPP